jgi:hypothetical protein
MKNVNPTKLFALHSADAALLSKYISPDEEISFIKGCPIDQKDRIVSIVKMIANKDSRIRIRYRGPRRDSKCGRRDHTLAADARAFAVYVD